MPQPSLPQKCRDFLNRHVLNHKPERRERKIEKWIGRLPPGSPAAAQLRNDLAIARNSARPYEALKTVKEAAKTAAAQYAGTVRRTDVETTVGLFEKNAAAYRVAKGNVAGIEGQMLELTNRIKTTPVPALRPTAAEHRKETDNRTYWRARMDALVLDWQRTIDIYSGARAEPAYRKLCLDLDILESDPAQDCEALRDRARAASAAFQRSGEFIVLQDLQRELAAQQQRFDGIVAARVLNPVAPPAVAKGVAPDADPPQPPPQEPPAEPTPLAQGEAESKSQPLLQTKQLGGDYEHETTQYGWRAEAKPEEGNVRQELWKMTREVAAPMLTEHWNDGQRSQHEMSIHPDSGAVSTQRVQAPDSYVVDPDGKTYLFKGSEQRQRDLTPQEMEKLQGSLERVQAMELECGERLRHQGITAEHLVAAGKLPPLYASLQQYNEGRDKVEAEITGLQKQLVNLKSGGSNGYEGVVDKSDEIARTEMLLGTQRRKLEMGYAGKKRVIKEIAALELELKGTDPKLLGDAIADQQALAKTKKQLQNSIASGKVTLMTHHSTPLEGGDVGGAGELKQDMFGRITEISNVSGHYKPQFVHLAQTIEHLMRQGALLDKTLKYIDDQGNVADLTSNDALNRLYVQTKNRLADLPDLKKRTDEATRKLAQIPKDPAEEEVKKLKKEFEQECQALQSEVTAIEDALRLLRKFGVGPANATSNAEVVFMDNIQHKTGKQIHLDKDDDSDKSKVEEFLASGGHHRVYDKDSGTYTDKTVLEAKTEVLTEIEMRAARHGATQLGSSPKQLEKAMSPEDHKKFVEAHRRPDKKDVKAALARLDPASAQGTGADDDALQSKLDELGVHSLLDAATKLGIVYNEATRETWDMLNTDSTKAKVLLGKLTLDQAYEQAQSVLDFVAEDDGSGDESID
jgi:hypothetical protein